MVSPTQQFKKNRRTSNKAVALSHAHYDDNECFSYTDLKNFIGHNGKFVLLNFLGELWYVTDKILKTEYKIIRPKDIRKNISKVYKTKSKKEQLFFYQKQETRICGKHIGSIH